MGFRVEWMTCQFAATGLALASWAPVVSLFFLRLWCFTSTVLERIPNRDSSSFIVLPTLLWFFLLYWVEISDGWPSDDVNFTSVSLLLWLASLPNFLAARLLPEGAGAA